MKLYVYAQELCEYSERAEEQFGSWSESYTFTVDRVSTSNRSSRRRRADYAEEFEIDVDVAPGEQVITLSIRWSTGDSFGNADGKGEVMWVFKDPILAGKAKHAWEVACGWHDETDWRQDNKTSSVEFVVDGGRVVKMSNPCNGYFERLQAVELEQFTIN